MTPSTTSDAGVEFDVFARPVADDPTAPRAAMAGYPRMADMIDRLRSAPGVQAPPPPPPPAALPPSTPAQASASVAWPHAHATPAAPAAAVADPVALADPAFAIADPAFPGAPAVPIPSEGPVAYDLAAATVAQAVAAPGVMVAHPNMPAPAPTPYDTLAVLEAPSRDAYVVEPMPLRDADDARLTDEELDSLIAELGLRDTAREALRARLIAFGQNRHQRTAYELVFLMLAFAVMVLITAPPLVQVLLALHGSAPS